MKVFVELTWTEMRIAGEIAVLWQVQNIMERKRPAYGAPEGEAGWMPYTTMAECAVAKHFNLFWMGNCGDRDAVDVGKLIEVRSCTRQTDCLILHPPTPKRPNKDPPHLPYVLVYPDPPIFSLLGWCWGYEGKQDQHWADLQGTARWAYFVKQKFLREIEELENVIPRLLREQREQLRQQQQQVA